MRPDDRTDPLRIAVWSPFGTGTAGGIPVFARTLVTGYRRLGHEVVFAEHGALDPIDLDLVHGVLLEPTHVRRCRSAGVPVVLSPIHWPVSYTRHLLPEARAMRPVRARLREAASLTVASLRNDPVGAAERMLGHELLKRMTYESADLLVPNSVAEGESIATELGVTTPFVPVGIGIDTERYTPGPLPWSQRSTVACVGRFEPHKNQLAVVRALRDSPYEVVFAGYVHPDHTDYLAQCRREAPAQWTFLTDAPIDEVVAVFQRARVHVLASRFETTGMVSLEAILAGARAVSTDRGFTVSCLGDLVDYVDPTSPAGIRAAVEVAYDSPPDESIAERVRSTWSSDAVAAQILGACTTHIPHFGRRVAGR